MYSRDADLTLDVAREVAEELEATGYFDRVLKKAYPEGLPVKSLFSNGEMVGGYLEVGKDTRDKAVEYTIKGNILTVGDKVYKLKPFEKRWIQDSNENFIEWLEQKEFLENR